MIAAVWLVILVFFRLFGHELYLLVAVASVISFPEYLYVFGIASVQKFLSLLFLAEIVYSSARARFPMVVGNKTFYLIAFFSIAMLSSLFSDAYEGVFIRSIFFSIQYVVLYLYVTYGLRRGIVSIKSIHKMVVIVFFVNLFVAYFERSVGLSMGQMLMPFADFNDGWDFVAREKVRLEYTRAQGLFVHPLALSMFAVFSLVSAYHLLFRSWCRFQYLLYFAFLLCAICLIYLTGSRSGFLALIAGVLVGAIKDRYMGIWIAILGAIISVVALAVVVDDAGFLSFIIDPLLGRGDYAELANSNSVRFGQVGEAMEAIQSSPVVGHGVDSAIHFMSYRTVDSLWLSGFVNFGVVGFGLYLFLVFQLAFAKCEGKVEYRMFFLMFMVFSLVISLNFLMLYSVFFLSMFFAERRVGGDMGLRVLDLQKV